MALTAGNAGAATVSGIVTDTIGTKLTSMTVEAYAPGDEKPTGGGKTDSSGRYSFGLLPGDYKLVAYDENGIFATSFGSNADSFDNAPVLHIDTADVSNYNFTLSLGGTIIGRVTAGNTGVGKAIVAVYNLSGTKRGFTEADDDGNYKIVVPAGQYKVVAYDNSKLYASDFFRSQGSFDAAAVVQVTASAATSSINFSLPVAGRASGAVFDRRTGAPVARLQISAYDAVGNLITSQTMTKDNTFDLALRPGVYRFVVADLTHQYAPEFYGGANTFADSTPVNVPSGAFQDGLRFDVIPAAHAAGRITNSTATPLPNITIAAYNIDGTQRTTATTGADGAYQIDLPPGAYKFVAFDNGLVYASKFFSAALDFPSAQEVDLFEGQTATIDLKLDVGGNFAGTVRDAATNLPASNVLIEAYDSNGLVFTSTTTGPDGKYRLVVAPAAYRLVASDASLRYITTFVGASAYEPSNEIAIAGGASATVDFQMKSGVLFNGTVKDTRGKLVSGVDVGMLDMQGNRAATARSKSGQFQVVLADGMYKLLAVDPQHRYAASFFNGALTFATATPITIRKDTPPPAVAFVLAPAPRRRAVGK